ncbi:hypothetical protein GCM10027566_00180 [Arachidicoccus ginsenosidivorans]|uniref:Uncharacterized protein n=1 Tax=Arachidicoccus ginsenosidivorans TaxID=496057 RepID=A0A5B8VUH1_9BACT|nr:phytanoyl-CoA dioxygenase family protein [Arachidicoccus ginsenosidivorans]QEC73798.1 hypothetical protein FSB73_21140 [Arachidicoccus ginsenosidivorans]
MEAVRPISGQLNGSHPYQIPGLFDQPQNATDWGKYIIPDWQLAFFERNGFVSGIQLIDEQVLHLINHLLANVKTVQASFLPEIVFHSPAYRMAAYQLLGKSFCFFHGNTLSGINSDIEGRPFQQDFSYGWSEWPMRHLSCQVELEDVNELNGCTYYVQGSHKFGLLPIKAATCSIETVKSVLSTKQLTNFDRKCASKLRKRCTSFYHPLTLHGAYLNITKKAGVVIEINATDCQNRMVMPKFKVASSRNETHFRQAVSNLFTEMVNECSFEPSLTLLFDADKQFWDLGLSIPKVDLQRMYALNMMSPALQ